jgi:hypothetical protein
MDILLGLLTIDELNDMLMLEAFHDGNFGLEVGKELGGEFRSDNRFDSHYGRLALLLAVQDG